MKAICLALASFGLATAAMAADERPPPPLTFVFEEDAQLGPLVTVGDTPIGRRQAVPITGGTFSGPGLSGRILPGGADYQLVRSDGAVVIDADYFIETDDHVTIHVRNVGLVVPPAGGAQAYAWTAPRFDAPAGKYAWLNRAIFISRISPEEDKDRRGVRITVFKVG